MVLLVAFRSSSRCRWWRPSATSAGRLPLGAGLRPVPVRRCRLSFSQLTADWVREDFYLPMLLLVVGQPMAVIPLLMLSTSVIAPIEDPSPRPGSTPSAASPG